MTVLQVSAAIVSAIVVPFLVQTIKTHAMSGNAARFVSILVSVIAGVITGFVGGVPANPAAWLTAIFAIVGGVQTAYAAFRAVGITNKWLDALLNLGNVSPPAHTGE